MRHDLLHHLDRLGRPRLLVVGDLILDRYTWGDAERVSPEAPVLVLRADPPEVRPGGAAAVAALARALDAEVSLAGVVGEDDAGSQLRLLLDEQGVEQGAVLRLPRPTTLKERFLGRAANRHPHQILRVDHEVREPLTPAEEALLADLAAARLEDCAALLVADYGKGVCTFNLVRRLVDEARQRGLPVLIDPARGCGYGRYRGATLLAPNRPEAEMAGGQAIRTPEDALRPARRLCEHFSLGAVLVKLDCDGMALVPDGAPGELLPTRARAVYDVTGAGDLVLAMAGVCLACGVPLAGAARLANVAAGLEVERWGVAPVSRAEVRAELLREGQRSGCKLVTAEDMAPLAEAYRREGKRVVFTNGCFELLHAGHVAYLQEAAELGDVLVVALNSDASVRRLKGAGRPVVAQEQRAALIAALGCVTHVLIFDEPTPHELLDRIRPDVLVKGGTYAAEEVVGREMVEEYGGRVCVTGTVDGLSTSGLLARVRGRAALSDADSLPAIASA